MALSKVALDKGDGASHHLNIFLRVLAAGIAQNVQDLTAAVDEYFQRRKQKQ